MEVLIRRNKSEGHIKFDILLPKYLRKEAVDYRELLVLQKAGCTIMDWDALRIQMAQNN